MANCRPTRSGALAAVGLAWLAVTAAGLGGLAQYSSASGSAADAPAQWPDGAHIRRASNRATLVMLAHPRCPCTRSSLEELAKLMAHSGGRLAAHVVFVRPQGFQAGWEHSDLWKSAAAIPDVQVWADPNGEQARRFGAITSGQVLVYDRKGRLLFSGGITAARGHVGDNAGRDAVLERLRSGQGPPGRSSVFGCSLVSPHGS